METERDESVSEKVCPACSSTTGVRDITDDEKAYAFGLYALHDYIGRIDWATATYYCEKCGYLW